MHTTKLHLNESPFSPGESIIKELEKGVQTVNRYPEWDAMSLRTALADHYRVDPEWVIVGNGSIGVIQQAMVASGFGEIVYGWPAFEAFEHAATAYRMPIRHVLLKDNACDLDAYLEAITPQTSIVIVCTPNAPTGGILGQDELETFIQKVPKRVIILIDEAYGEFVDEDLAIDSLSLAQKYENVMFTRTFSKAYGLAGVRVGYGIAQPQLAERIAKAGLPFPVPMPFQAAALAALAEPQRLASQIAAISKERHRLAEELRDLGADVVEGYANFVWLPVGDMAQVVVQALHDQGVLVKPVMPHGVRISVGTSEDTDAVCAAWQAAGITALLRGEEAEAFGPVAVQGGVA